MCGTITITNHRHYFDLVPIVSKVIIEGYSQKASLIQYKFSALIKNSAEN